MASDLRPRAEMRRCFARRSSAFLRMEKPASSQPIWPENLFNTDLWRDLEDGDRVILCACGRQFHRARAERDSRSGGQDGSTVCRTQRRHDGTATRTMGDRVTPYPCGHPRDDANNKPTGRGGFKCRTCHNSASRARQATLYARNRAMKVGTAGETRKRVFMEPPAPEPCVSAWPPRYSWEREA